MAVLRKIISYCPGCGKPKRSRYPDPRCNQCRRNDRQREERRCYRSLAVLQEYHEPPEYAAFKAPRVAEYADRVKRGEGVFA
jgi:hypothetical protein